MSAIRENSFNGMFPKVAPFNLPQGGSSYATDVDFSKGDLRGLPVSSSVSNYGNLGQIKSMYVQDTSYYAWGRDVDVVRSPVIDDSFDRFYWADGTGFYVTPSGSSSGGEPSGAYKYKVGVPDPGRNAPTLVTGQTFALQGVSSAVYTLACELSDGTTANAVTLTNGSKSVDTLTSSTTTWTNSAFPLCAVTPTAGSTASTTTYTKLGTILITITNDLLAEHISVPQYSYNNAKYIRNADADATAWGSVVYSWETLTSGAIAYTAVGGGWYSSTASALPITAAIEAASMVVGSLLTMVMTLASGATLTAKIRETADTTTWPIELPGYSAQMTRLATTVTLKIWLKTSLVVSRAYAYSYVNQWGEESGLSDPLSVDATIDGQVLKIGFTQPADSGYCPVSRIRLYRTGDSTTSSGYLFVLEQVKGSAWPAYLIDGVLGANLGAPCQTIGVLPPNANLFPIGMMANGVIYGLKNNEVHFCDPYLPSCWRRQNIQTLANKGVGACSVETGLYVTTTAYPYLISGVDPSSMTQMKLPAIQAGVHKNSIVNVGATVVWASHDGLVTCRGLDANLTLSYQFWTRNVWRSNYESRLSSLRLATHDGRLVAWFTDGSPGFIVRLDENEGFLTHCSETISGSFVNPLADAMYVTSGTTVSEFLGGYSERAWERISKEFHMPKPCSMGVIQLFGSGTVSVAVIADGILVLAYKTLDLSVITSSIVNGLNGSVAIRLPSGFKATRWQVSLKSATGGRVQEYTLASTPSELQNG